ncbi:MAG: hypothetical protein Fur005_33250 [Roseiflexaceae bacterium]
MAKLTDVEGIGPTYAEKLGNAGINTTNQLFEHGATAKGRNEIAEQSGISVKLILQWVNHLDLERVKGIGWEYADLLEAAGVDTVPELAQRNPTNLHAALEKVNAEKQLTKRTPSLSQVEAWVGEAKELPRMIAY